MTRIVLEMSMSLDGYTAGPDIGVEFPLGRGGEALHDWMFLDRPPEEVERFQRSLFERVGAVIVGRRMADLGIPYWGDDPVFHAPVFVVTHRPAATIDRAGGTSYIFVTDPIEAVVGRARDAAGERDIVIGGGAAIARLCLAAGVVDEIRLHIAPIALGGGTRLFDADLLRTVRLTPVRVTTEPLATHVTYEVANGI